VSRADKIREKLRSLPVFSGDQPEFDIGAAPEDPGTLFEAWFEDALDRGVSEPHAFTLSTTGAQERPNARVVILKGLESDGRWPFATSAASQKATEIEQIPWAAATFYWREVGRQVRVRGRVAQASAEDSARDFLARSEAARAEAMHGHQSEVLDDPADLDAAIEEGQARIAADPQTVAETWTLYHLIPDEVEFWQADRDRRHTRLRYRLTDGTWSKEQLWP
jgi:pyridoxamine 5'-phosphate oxidase